MKTPIQELINGKPSEFARRIGCPKSTANHYSDGTRTPPEWVLELIKNKLKQPENLNYADWLRTLNTQDQNAIMGVEKANEFRAKSLVPCSLKTRKPISPDDVKDMGWDFKTEEVTK